MRLAVIRGIFSHNVVLSCPLELENSRYVIRVLTGTKLNGLSPGTDSRRRKPVDYRVKPPQRSRALL